LSLSKQALMRPARPASVGGVQLAPATLRVALKWFVAQATQVFWRPCRPRTTRRPCPLRSCGLGAGQHVGVVKPVEGARGGAPHTLVRLGDGAARGHVEVQPVGVAHRFHAGVLPPALSWYLPASHGVQTVWLPPAEYTRRGRQCSRPCRRTSPARPRPRAQPAARSSSGRSSCSRSQGRTRWRGSSRSNGRR
jgi:hypothetical protein